jgi:ADP-dependent NAD(P)H-hydrate dehydratase / NAD(P)H-hydrate epimerase
VTALPGWLTPLPDAAQQRETDRWAIEERGIPGIGLMERAGAGLAAVLAERVPAGRVAVVVGRGNNGGDGLVVARLLREAGRDVDVLLVAPGDELRGDALVNLQRLPGPAPRPLEAGALAGAAVVVDAILGTGFTGAPHGPAAAAIEAVIDAGVPVLACDFPSGVDASTGEVQGRAVRAQVTVSFHAGKPGLWIAPGKSHAGEVVVIDIGIPGGAPVVPSAGLIGDALAREVPRRGADSTKFAAGAVHVCGGSAGLTGAPCLAAEAAARAGAGYVTALVPASLQLVFEQRLLEVMTVGLPDEGGALGSEAVDLGLESVARADALVLGPGLGRAPDTAAFARALARQVPTALVLDADGLNAHAGVLRSLASRDAPTVLTPHAGELARLLDTDSAAIGARRLQSARAAAAAAGAVVVLKGDDTIVAAPDGRVAVSRGGAPALATAGTGDVLAGVTGAYLAKHMDPFSAACAAVLVHLRAGRLAADRIGPEGVIASDVVAALPAALSAAIAGASAGDRTAP